MPEFKSTINVQDNYTLPTADGSDKQKLETDGAGNLDWVYPAEYKTVYNDTGATIPKKTLVRIDNSLGAFSTIVTADNSTCECVDGITVEDIGAALTGRIQTVGTLNETWLNTSGLTAGSVLYLGTSGNYTETQPTSGFVVKIGKVGVVATSSGSIILSMPAYNVDFDELSGVPSNYVSYWGADITDTTGASLQTALDAMVTAGVDTAYLDEGVWQTDQTIVLKLSLIGVGKNSSIIQANNSLNADVVRIEGFVGGKGNYRTYRDFQVDGNAANQTGGSGIVVTIPTAGNSQADFLIFDSIYVHEPKVHGLDITDASSDLIIAPRIVNSDFLGDSTNTTGDGVRLGSSTYDAFLDNLDIGYFKQGSGVYMVDGRGDQLSNCKSWQNLHGYNFVGGRRTQVANCLSDYSGAHGMRLENCDDHLLITGCTFRKSSANTNNLFESIAILNSSDIQFYNCAAYGDAGTDPAFPNNPSYTWFIGTGCANIRAKGIRSEFNQTGYANVGTVTNVDIYDQGEVRITSSGDVEISAFSTAGVVKNNASGVLSGGNNITLTELDTTGASTNDVITYNGSNPVWQAGRVRQDGTIQPVSLADSSAANDSIYYSTTQNKLVYKDSGGTVNSLY
jgi:hypothetical protein